jgi:hypothetical protein
MKYAESHISLFRFLIFSGSLASSAARRASAACCWPGESQHVKEVVLKRGWLRPSPRPSPSRRHRPSLPRPSFSSRQGWSLGAALLGRAPWAPALVGRPVPRARADKTSGSKSGRRLVRASFYEFPPRRSFGGPVVDADTHSGDAEALCLWLHADNRSNSLPNIAGPAFATSKVQGAGTRSQRQTESL